MATLSIPLPRDLEEFVVKEVRLGHAENKAAVVRKALRLLVEEEAVMAVLRAEREPTLSGDLDDLARRIA